MIKTTISLESSNSKSPTLVELDIKPKPKVNFTLESISHDSGNPTVHEEISGPTSDRDVPSLDQKRVGSSKVDGAPTHLGAVEDKCEAKPGRERVLGVVDVDTLGPTHRFGPEIVVEGDWIVENDDVSKVELARQDGQVGSLRRCHYGWRGIGRVFTVVDYVVEEED